MGVESTVKESRGGVEYKCTDKLFTTGKKGGGRGQKSRVRYYFGGKSHDSDNWLPDTKS